MPASLPRARYSVSSLLLGFVILLVVFSSLIGTVPAFPGLEKTGRWTDTTSAVPWGHTQIHMTLLRGDASYHSKLLSWAQFNTTLGQLEASFWGWNPGGSLADSNCASYPTSRFTTLSLDLTNIPSLFCAGHATLADGNLLVTGGDDGANVGLRDSYLFRPNPTGSETRWQRMGDMEQERWYPSNVALPDGNMMVFAGGRFAQMLVFGGTQTPLQSSYNNRRNVERLGLTAAGRWQSAIPYDGTANWPQAREGHSAVWFPHVKHMVIFGGRGDGDGSTKYNNLYRLKLNTRWSGYLDDRYEYVWKEISPDAPQGLPQERDRHSAVMINENTMVVFGGRRQSGPTLSDVYRLTTTIAPPNTTWTWTPISPTGPSPGARHSHAALFDPGGNRMLLFGGSNNSGVVNDQEVYALSASNMWSTVTLTAGSLRPTAREGHSWVVDPFLRNSPLSTDPNDSDDDRRLVLFGGKTSNGVRQKDVWALWIHNNGNATWQSLPDPPSGVLGVTRHSAMWDLSEVAEGGHGRSHDRMLVFGGETADSARSALWDMDGDTLSTPRWTQRNGHPLLALAGQSALHYLGEDRTTHFLDALRVEEYDAGSGQWAVRDTAQLLWAYPHVFLLPSGNIFYSGPAATSQRYTRTATPAQWLEVSTGTIFGDAAVMYRPDQILRSGNPAGVNYYPISGAAQKITISPPTDYTTGWQPAGTMLARSGQNLTVLPDGKVLVTGGLKGEDIHQPQAINPAERRPQVWDPATNLWSDSTGANALAEDPAWRRAYHSTAILLPDGRVMAAGGEAQHKNDSGHNPTWDRPTIFCPPYLFKADGTLAARPTIYSAPDTIGYGYQAMQIFTTDAPTIASASLIRPGAVTHGFGQDQRYVPLQIAWTQDCEVRLTGPGTANEAPPGDYLLFIVNQSGVPCVAKWVRVRAGSMVGPFSVPPECPGGGGCPVVDTQTESGWKIENTILNRSKDGSLSSDVYRLKHQPAVENGTLSLRIRENEQELTTLDHAALVAVDHPPDLQVFAAGSGFVLGERRPAHRVRRESGEDVTPIVVGSGARFQGQPGDVLLVDLYAPGEEPTPLSGVMERGGALEFEEKQGPIGGGGKSLQPTPGLNPVAIDAAVLDHSGIRIQVPDDAGRWRTIEHRYPREHMDEAMVLSGNYSQMRLEFVGRHRLGFVGWIAPVRHVPGIALPLVKAHHSNSGDVAERVGDVDGRNASLRPGESIELSYEVSPIPPGRVRDYFLRTHGVYTALTGQPDLGAGLVPARFALYQNRPNPFAQSTVIEFELASSGPVRLEVFDLLGRRVKTLATGGRQAGLHAVEWDRTDRNGSLVAPGVYVYRLTARGLQDQKRMVLLP